MPDIGSEDYTPPPVQPFVRVTTGRFRVEVERPGGATWDVTQDVVTGSVTNVITNETDTATIELRDPDGSRGYATLFQDGDIVKVWTGRTLELLVLRFAGPLTGRPFSLDGSWRTVSLAAQDYSHLLHHRLVADVFLDTDSFQGKPHLIIKKLIDDYAPDFTYNNVDDSPTIISFIGWKYESVFSAIEQISEFVNWDWYVDTDQDVHFFDRKNSKGTIELTTNLPDANIKRGTASFEPDTSRLENRVFVIGGKFLTANPYVQRFLADGVLGDEKESEAEFLLAYAPYVDQEQLADGVITNGDVTVIEDPEGTGSGGGSTGPITLTVGKFGKAKFLSEDPTNGVKVLVDPDERRFYFDQAIVAAPPDWTRTGRVFKVTFKHYVPVIEALEDTQSILDHGGDPAGVHEAAVVNPELNDRRMARAFARIRLRKYAREYWRGGCEVYTDDVFAGLVARFVVPELGMNRDMTIKSVTRSFTAPAVYSISVQAEEDVSF